MKITPLDLILPPSRDRCPAMENPHITYCAYYTHQYCRGICEYAKIINDKELKFVTRKR